jgi:DNA-binding transcriptional ArsR family regulator
MPQPLDEQTEVCIMMMAERTGTPYSTCEKHLKALEKEGKLTSRRAVWNSKSVIAYRRVT